MSSADKAIADWVADLRAEQNYYYFPVKRRIPRLHAWSLALLIFFATFGSGLIGETWAALAEKSPQSWATAAYSAGDAFGVTALSVVASCAVVRWLSSAPSVVPRPDMSRRMRVKREMAVGSLVTAVMALSFIPVMSLNETSDLDVGWHPESFKAALDCFEAGFREEFLLCLAIPLLLRSAGHKLWITLLVVAAMRVSFHLYYGPGAIALGLWAAVAALLVLKTGCIIGVVVLHSLWDVLIGVPMLFNETVLTWAIFAKLTVFMMSLVIAWRYVYRDLGKPKLE